MDSKPSHSLLRIVCSLAGLALLSAFSYPLVQEGYQKMGSNAYQEAQLELLTQSIKGYLAFRPDIDWNSSTPTTEILYDLEKGLDRDFDGRAESYLPSSLGVDEIAANYRILYKSPQSFKVVRR